MANDHTFSIGEFAAVIRETLVVSFPRDVWVQGEVRNISRPSSGHVYFDLVDPSPSPGQPPEAVLSVMLMRTTKNIVNRQIKGAGGGVRIDDGVKIRIGGAPDFYAPQGRLQLQMHRIDPDYTLGQMLAQREQLVRQLAADGLLRTNAALAMPQVPLRIGLVTAKGSAAYADFMHELERSGLAFEVLLASTTVQGDAAVRGVAAAIATIDRRGVDLIAIVRGGGARTDLVAFDSELVARTIATARVPVLTGIGHEVDRSVADDVAAVALKTPTACAAYLVEIARTAETRSLTCWDTIVQRSRVLLATEAIRVADNAQHVSTRASRALARAERGTEAAAQRASQTATRQLMGHSMRLSQSANTTQLLASHQLAQAEATATRSVEQLKRQSKHHLASAERSVAVLDERRRLLDPARALARGWSITTDANGQVIKSIADIAPGDELTTRLADGAVASTVHEAVPTEDHV